MKKITSLLVAVLTLLICSVCFADIPPSEVALGGINLGATPEYIKSIYGEPTSYDQEREGTIIYNYNGTFKIMFVFAGKSYQYMYWMETTANNGITTPSGVAVGMNASVLDKYGEVYYDEFENGIRYKAFWAQGRKVLIFGIKNKKIVSIKAAC